MNAALNQTVNRTPNPDCPACQHHKLHTESEWKQFHPLAGTGRYYDVAVGAK